MSVKFKVVREAALEESYASEAKTVRPGAISTQNYSICTGPDNLNSQIIVETWGEVKAFLKQHLTAPGEYVYITRFNELVMIIGEPVDSENSENSENKESVTYVAHDRCDKCQGTGSIAAFSHIQNGFCYTCRGTGVSRLANPANLAYTGTVTARIHQTAKEAADEMLTAFKAALSV